MQVKWRATEQQQLQVGCLHQFFEQQVEQCPDRIALVQGDQHLSYEELNRRANQLAHVLQTQGVEPEVRVGLCMERCPEMVIAIIAVLKAGGAYVPVDVSLPQQRLLYQLQDAQVALVLTQEWFIKMLQTCQVPLLCLDQAWQQLAAADYTSPPSQIQPDNLIYVIYTSGSTGHPKGVMNIHHALCNHFRWMLETYPLLPQDRVLQKTSVSFDVSVSEIFWPLLSGAQLILAHPNGHRDSAYLLQLIIEQQITNMQCVPSLLQVLLEEPGIGCCTSLQRVLCAGEVLLPSLQERFFACLDAQLHNLYGPTEASIYASFWACQKKGACCTVPIGSPIANTQLYILDAHFHPVPTGVSGELYIGGDALARGYLDRPELTAERFIPDPFSYAKGARLYKTGDLARALPDGTIEYIGRLDDQVKIHGFRVELGEIKQNLQEQPGVRETIVVVRDNIAGSRQLVAYIVAVQGQQTDQTWLETVRATLGQRLPEYMVPYHIVVLDALPLTSSGKVDRQALPHPILASPRVDQQASRHVQSPIEQWLVDIWQEVLHVPVISASDHFFALGGHSLAAMQVMARVRQRIGIELPVRELFEAPTLIELAHRVEHALRDKQSVEELPLIPTSCTQSLPLSYAQQRLWFLDQLDPNQPTYNVPLALRLHGPLSSRALEASLRYLEARHDGLRLYIEEYDDQVVQGILPIGNLSLLKIDLTNLSSQEQEEEQQRLICQEAHCPFDLRRGPLWRVRLLQLKGQEWVLLLILHHIITDGWSNSILLQELGKSYIAFCQDQEPILPMLPVCPADYAIWQRAWLQGERQHTQLVYWREQLANLEPLALPTDYARPARLRYRGSREKLSLSTQLYEQVQALSRQEGVTLFMTLLAGWLVVLQRYSGQTNLTVGTPVANRTHTELEGVIGFFVNTLVLHCEVKGQMQVRELLKQVREKALQAYSHRELPFDRIVEAVQPERDLSRHPIFQVMFILQPKGVPLEPWNDVTVQQETVDLNVAKFDLTLIVEEGEQGLVASLEYNTDLFAPETVRRMVLHWQQVLTAMVAQPEQSVANLSLLTPEEKELQLMQWNATAQAYPQDLCLHELFEQQVEQCPDTIALVQGKVQLTYEELNRRANQLAHYLQGQGVGPEVRVGVCVERSPEMVIAIIAVLKAGGAYVPMDVSLPKQRLLYQLQDAQVVLVLTQGQLIEMLASCQLPVFCLDREWHLLSTADTINPQSLVQPDNLIYIIYTSGSTGRPKGAMNVHRGLSNSFRWLLDTYPLCTEDRVLQRALVSFDTSIREMFWPLLSGAQLVLIHPDGYRDSMHLLNLIHEHHITNMYCVPSLLKALLVEPVAGQLTSLQHVLCAGEVLSSSLQERFFACVDAKLINAYGPSETAIEVVTSDCTPTTTKPIIPIGTPIANTQIYLLDRHMQPVPIGVPGELYIGGEALGRGYQNQPMLTAERFVPNPFSLVAGSRLYRTGDLARYSPDGVIEFVGRVDYQVKLRGMRIELGEIEQILLEFSGVGETVVVAQDSPSGSKQLVAYVVPTQSQEADLTWQEAMWMTLRQHLPEYMVPSQLVVLGALPLNPNGKIDRQALLQLGQQQLGTTEQSFVAPQTQIEQTLACIWRQVLRLSQVGIHDNFFALGGDSILSLSVIAQARQTNLSLSVNQLFQAPTIAQLSQLVTQLQPSDKSARQPRRISQGEQLLTPVQHWFFEQHFANPHHWNQAFLFQLPAHVSISLLEQSLQWVLGQHDVFRLRFTETKPNTWQARYLPTPELASFIVVDLRELPQEQQTVRVTELCNRAQASLCMSSGPLLLPLFFQLSRVPSYRLLLVCHHLIIDTVSWRILLEDISQTYQALSRGHTPQPLPISSSFQEWAERLRNFAQTEISPEEIIFWQQTCLPQAPLLPMDKPAGINRMDTVQILAWSLSVQETQTLLRDVPRRLRATIEEVLLSALGLGLFDCFGISTISIDLEGHGREDLFTDIDLSRTIGWFTCVYPVVLNLQRQPQPLTTLRTVKSLLRRIPRRGVGYGILRYLHPDPEVRHHLQRQPQSCISFNYLGQFDQVLGGETLFTLAPETTGFDFGPENQRVYQIDVEALIVQEQLHLSLLYSNQLHQTETMQRLVHHYLARLQQLIALS